MRRLLVVLMIFCLLVVACSSNTSREVGTAAPAATNPVAAASPSPAPSAASTPSAAPSAEQTSTATSETPAASAEPAQTSEGTAAGLPELASGWTRIDAGGEAMCARGTPYSFWVRPGTVNKLLIYFQGGGGCWSAETCRQGSTFFQDAADERDNPSYESGIFDLENPDNPFKDYYIVYVPYCTGDVHLGNNVYTYKDASGEEIVIHHKGFVNASTVMEWVYQQFKAPESIFVSGCSAGSVGSIMFAPYVIEHYRSVPVVQMGDSEAFVFGRPVELQEDWRSHDNFPDWIPAVRAIEPGQWTAEKFYTAIANFYPDRRFSQYNTAHDSVQIRYFRAANGVGSWEEALDASMKEIHAKAPNFRSYLAGGSSHCITPFGSFYAVQSDGVYFRDWVDAMANGRDVENVRCTNCDSSE
ncbi:MAG TPA: pectin acetylesterase-family hydrolase [Herpetosiphonaceae bacterium]